MADSTPHAQNGSPPATAGVKRKRPHETKFYAVREGRKAGVYSSWAECLEQVKGHKNALFQAFPSLTAAEAFVAGNASTNTTATSGTKSSAPTKFYGVRVGRRPGVYTDWPSAQAQIVGWKAPRYKRFDSKAQAEAYVTAAPTLQVTNGESAGRASTEVGQRQLNGSAGMVRVEQTESLDVAGPWPLPPGAEDAFDPNIKLMDGGKVRYKTTGEKNQTKIVSTGGSGSAKLLKIYTDGSSLGNGKGSAVGGVGVYFGPGHKSNVSEPLQGPRQTNQRAELTALLRALEIAPLYRPVEIYTDSRYSINCVTQWYDNWNRNGWTTAKGAKVENKDLITEVKRMMDERKDVYGAQTTFVWVKGHAATEGNVMADRLAVQGARGNVVTVAAPWEDEDYDHEYGNLVNDLDEAAGIGAQAGSANDGVQAGVPGTEAQNNIGAEENRHGGANEDSRNDKLNLDTR